MSYIKLLFLFCEGVRVTSDIVWSNNIKEYHRCIFSTNMNMNNKHTTREPDLFELCGLSVYLSVFKRLADKKGINGNWKDFQWED